MNMSFEFSDMDLSSCPDRLTIFNFQCNVSHRPGEAPEQRIMECAVHRSL